LFIKASSKVLEVPLAAPVRIAMTIPFHDWRKNNRASRKTFPQLIACHPPEGFSSLHSTTILHHGKALMSRGIPARISGDNCCDNDAKTLSQFNPISAGLSRQNV
jgi:hypothetical protein